MPEDFTIYEQAVTTDRPAKMLARRHGFESPAMLAASLPPGAEALDVGAGASSFGREIATLRPDITWTNFDYSYQNPAILAEVTEGSPDNVHHVFGDATKLQESYAPETFDAVFSYWLVPHLSLREMAPAVAAARGMLILAKQGGLVSIGPKTSRLIVKSGQAIQVTKQQYQDTDILAEVIAERTRIPEIGVYIQSLTNRAATDYFGTSRYSKRSGRTGVIYYPETGTYVPTFSEKGVKTIGKLAVHTIRYAALHSHF